MLKLRMKANGRESLVIGLTPTDMLKLISEGVLMLDGESFGLGEDRAIVLMAGMSHQEMMQSLEENLPVKFPKDDNGNYLPVNS